MLTALAEERDARPLDQFKAIRSRDPETVRDALISTFGARRFTLDRSTPQFAVRANRWQSGSLGLSYCSCNAKVEVEFPAARFFRQQFGLRGAAISHVARKAYAVNSKETCVVQPGSELNIEFIPDFEQIVLRLDADVLRSKLAALLGADPGRELVFEPSVRLDTPLGNSLKRAVSYFTNEVNGGGMGHSPAALAELEQNVIVAFLFCNRSNFSPYLESEDRALASYQLRKAEDYIAAHWNEPLTIEAIAIATSVSARSIFHHFRKKRGQSPMTYLKQVRLEHARRKFMRGGDEVSVTDVAFACGFGNLGHFANDYFRRFGELPSETIRIARSSSC